MNSADVFNLGTNGGTWKAYFSSGLNLHFSIPNIDVNMIAGELVKIK